MSRYLFTVESFDLLTWGTIEKLIRSQGVSQLIFPATLEAEVVYENPEQFTVTSIPSHCTDKEMQMSNMVFAKGESVRLRMLISHAYSSTSFNFRAILEFSLSDWKTNNFNHKNMLAYLQAFTELMEVQHARLFPSYSASLYQNRFQVYKRSLRLQLGWMFYFGPEWVKIMGQERFNKLKTYHDIQNVGKGIFLTLQDDPFDVENEEHLRREQLIISELGLEDFIVR